MSETRQPDARSAGEPRWLSAAEQVSWRAFIDAIRLFTAEIDRELQRNSGLNHAYYQILVTLSEAPERTMRMSELAALTLTSRSRLSHAVARLEEAGWIQRHSCPSDKRGSFAVMTEAGYDVLEVAARGHVEAVRRNLFDVLSAGQVQELGEISAVLRDALRAGPVARCLGAEQAAEEAGAWADPEAAGEGPGGGAWADPDAEGTAIAIPGVGDWAERLAPPAKPEMEGAPAGPGPEHDMAGRPSPDVAGRPGPGGPAPATRQPSPTG